MTIPPVDRGANTDLRQRQALARLQQAIDDLQTQITNITANGLGNAESFVSKLDGDLTVTFSNAASTAISFSVLWKKHLHFNAAIYSHNNTTSPEEITIVTDGVYQFEFDVSHNDDKATLDFWVEVNVAGAWAWRRVKYAVLVTTFQTYAPFITFGMSVGIPILAGTKVRIRGRPGVVGGLSASATCSLFSKSTRLSIIKVANVSNGGTGLGVGWDGTPPTWTEAPP